MPGNLHHQLAQLEGAGTQVLTFQVTDPATVTSVSGPQFFTGDVTCTTRGVGRYDVAITNFRGALGVAHVIPSVVVPSTNPTQNTIFITTAPTYSGDTLSFGVGINTNTSTGGAANWHCLVLGF